MTLRRSILCAVLALLPAAAQADTFFAATLTGAAVIPAPPIPSLATGFARVRLNDAGTFIHVAVHASGLGPTVTAVHIHAEGSPDGFAGILITLPLSTITPGVIVDANLAIAPATVPLLQAGTLFLDVHTNTYPGGEIRGALPIDPVFVTTITGEQLVPPVSAAGTARGYVSLNVPRTHVLVTVEWNGLSANVDGIHLHEGRPGVGGHPAPICFLLVAGGPSGLVSDALCVVTPAQAAALESGGLYVDIHTPPAPLGARRGQIKRSFNACDFDGDGKSDYGIVRQNGLNLDWWIKLSAGGIDYFSWGASPDVVLGRFLCPDVDGDGRADATIYRTGPPNLFWTRLSTGGIRVQEWGMPGDEGRAIADYDGDGRDDYAIYRVGTLSAYWILESTTNAVRFVPFGTQLDVPLPAPDYDGDGRADFGVRRTSVQWRKFSSTGGIDAVNWGVNGDSIMSGDYDGDGRTDLAVNRIVGVLWQWWIRSSVTGAAFPPYGNGYYFGSLVGPAAFRIGADIDGDRRTDVAVWKVEVDGPGVWWVQGTKTGLTTFFWGVWNDVPVHRYYHF